jgi:DNA-binding NarL/FixJ family response regulator
VVAGEAALPRALVARLIDEFRGRGHRVWGTGNPGAELTPRQWEVLHLMRDGLSTNEIAERLFVSPVTVRRHVSTILQRMQVPDRESAVRALDHF